MNKPNFLIVGAPKCGTTSLYDYLNQHPEIFLPSIKEPHYFGEDLSNVGFAGDRQKYLDLFKSSDKQIMGEASTWYLYSEKAAQEIYEFNPDIKIIVMLRNPVDAAKSLHNQTLFGLNEDQDDFYYALSLEESRMNGYNIPKNNKRVEAIFYTNAFRYGTQLKRYFDLFESTKIHVLLFEDFINNTQKMTNGVYKFLGASSPFTADMKVENSRKTAKSKFLQSIISKKDKKITKVIPPTLRAKFHQFLKKVNSKKKKKQPVPQRTKTLIYGKLEEEIQMTEKLLDINLNDWKIN